MNDSRIYFELMAKYRKIPKVSPRAYIFQGPFWGAYFWRGLSTEGNLRFKIDWASRLVGSKFTVFVCFTLYLRVIFQVQAPWVLIFGGVI